ncbi:octopamine receptor-like [Actinia tenebrosa]|uniref:Octopamine receptor-like n=1 Tax=Actinia tenebrosa TaxID=6105 RepID=A0A6P8IBB3_ACTTE|nr:octopamine receptor-like [Actinia tenebrosa]XP_031562712.1 octopamine receptor-like [Actinia tenebrosa]XP_031562713.1 octopamine receptor-like [Actinia tenebrosa]XP_031562714.1 octopamine receptor-like [Actinia tenebrosa]XP_031562715.1 octopamine receptor-like [Actinia tenebrosa]XP_031562716.1 octopamine receptor-like [Actinia tenebrosa]XP_031562717.1 octopamine receptor-like [Actinia tenebrosa]XP_031562718.1 octopamine receptor-like [Actinia tenebrosa]XP_031562720.1 octopamine receptor-
MNNSSGFPPMTLMPLPEVIAWCSAYVIVDALIVIGNALTLAVFYTNKRLLRMRANYFLVNLAIADLFVGIIAVPIFTYYLAAASKRGHVVWNEYPYQIAKVLDIFIGCASIFTLAIIALERAFSVCFPHVHRGIGKKSYMNMIAVVWVLSFLMAVLRTLFIAEEIGFNVFFYFLIVSFCISIILICISYPVIGIRMNYRFANVEKHRKKNDHDRRLALMLFIVTTIFIFTWLPFHILNVVTFFCRSCRSMPNELPYIIKLLHYGNSCVNPIIYSYLVPEFRRTVIKLFCGKNKRKAYASTQLS